IPAQTSTGTNQEIVGVGAAAAAGTYNATFGSYTRRTAASTTAGTFSIVLGDGNVASSGTAVAAATGAVTFAANTRTVGISFGLLADNTSPTSGAYGLAGNPSGKAYQASPGSAIFFAGAYGGTLTISDPFADAQSTPFSVTYPA